MAVLAIPLAVGLSSSAIFGTATFLGVSAFGWGWAIGSMAASYLLAPDQEGPRLTDLSAGGSEYGRPIPLCYGTTKVAGNVIWASDLIETEHTESAKGGPEITTYSYSQHLQVLVCAGEVTGIRKIWANGRLVLDASDTNTGSTGQSGNIRVYTGTETQVADSLIESYKGAGNVPAHRGYCHVVFESLQLEDYGNRTPSFEFEVVADGAFSYASVVTLTGETNFGDQPMVALPGNRLAYTFQTGSPYHTNVRIFDSGGTMLSDVNIGVNAGAPGMAYASHADQLWIFFDAYVYKLDAQTGEYIGATSTGTTGIDPRYPIYDALTDRVVVVDGGTNKLLKFFDESGLYLKSASSINGVGSMVIPSPGVLWTNGGSDYETCLQLFDMQTMTKLGEVCSTVQIGASVYGDKGALLIDPARNRVIWHVGANVACFDIDTGECTNFTITGFPSLATSCTFMVYNPITDMLYAHTAYSGIDYLLHIDPDTFAVSTYMEYSQVDVRADGFGVWAALPGDYLFTYASNSLGDGGVFKLPITQRLSANQVALSSIVTDLCERAGLTASDIDVTDLTDMVDGYKTT